MSSIALLLAYLGCLSSSSMLSMLLLLVAAYVSAAMWLLSHGVYYSGLLYVLVYVGAIVVLIIFVVQLTNTSLSGDTNNDKPYSLLALLQTATLLIGLSVLLVVASSVLSYDLLLSVSNFNVSTPNSTNFNTTFNNIGNVFSEGGQSTLATLASSIFNEYGYILVVSVHAIILAVIGPIKLALADLK